MMSVLSAFGSNLKLLCKERGSQSAVADALGISKVQFQRYLKGESFPKPNLLKRICDYFGVDARILTDELGSAGILRMRQGFAPFPETAPASPAAEAMAYACRSDSFFAPGPQLPDGFYLVWRHAMAQQGRISCTLHQVRTLSRSRVVKAYDLKAIRPADPSENAPRSRVFRGILLRQTTGFVAVYYYEEPWNIIALSYVNGIDAVNADTMLAGFSVLCRDELPGMNRMSRCAWQRVPLQCGPVLAAARRRGLYDPRDVPPAIMALIGEPVR